MRSRDLSRRVVLALPAFLGLVLLAPRTPAETVLTTESAATRSLLLRPEDTVLELDRTNYSGDTGLAVHTWPDHRASRAILMKFDLASLPPGAVVREATLLLTLVASDANAEATYAVTAHKVLGKNAVIAAATGYTTDGVTAWSPSACCSSSIPLAQADLSPAYDRQAIDKVVGAKSWTLTRMVQEWQVDPATNFGVVLNPDLSQLADRYRLFASTEHPDAGIRPALRITYAVPTTVALAPQDTYLNTTATNYSTEPRLATYTWPDYQVANAILMKFDLSSLPAGAVVNEANLRLALVESDAAPEATYTVAATKVVGKNPDLARATGYTTDGTVGWTPNLCCYDGVPLAQADISPAQDARAIDKTPGFKVWTVTRMVQEWLADPATNFGLLLNSDASKPRDRYRYFASMESADPALRPVLQVAYTLPSASQSLSPEDTFLNVNDTNYATNPWLGTYTWPQQRPANAILMKFDLPALPAGAVIEEATLHLALTASDRKPEATYAVSAHKVVGKNPVVAAATGYTFDGLNGWTPNACCYDGVPLAQADISPAYDARDVDKARGYKVWTVTRMVQEWLADPATNFGLLLNPKMSGGRRPRLNPRDRYRYFASMEDPDSRVRPFLRIAYTLPTTGDSTPPVAALTAPLAGATVTGTVTVAATASDDVGVAGVQFKLDGANLGAEDATAPYSVSWDTRTVSNGAHTLTAVARDAGGNVAASAAVTVTAANDKTAPSVAVTAPAGGATVNGTVTVAATASDNVGVAGVQFRRNGANLGAEDTTSPYTVSWNTAGVANGTHTLTAVARDAAGNVTTSAGVAVTVANVDATAPSVSISAPSGGATVSGSVAVTASASDNVAVAGVQFKLDGANLGAEDTASPWSVAWNTAGVANGSHALTAVARDAAGNSTTSAAVAVTVSNTAPGAGLAALYPGDAGIEGHADVVFVERFEDTALSTVFGRWNDVLNGAGMSLAPDVPPGSPGARSLNIPWAGGGVSDGGHLYKQLTPGVEDTLYVRYYVKYPPSGSYQHTGVWMGGYNPALSWPNPQAGVKPAGNDRFIAAAEQNTLTSRFDHYDYWMNMRPSGDGNYWGNLLLNSPAVQARAGQWMCVEHMVKLNNPVTDTNGEHAVWLDGVKVSHLGKGFPKGTWSGGIFTQDPAGSPFEGFRWRSDANLKLNWIWLQNYASSDPAGFSADMYFDHLVVAKSYIGCLASSGPADTTPPSVSLTAPLLGAILSGTGVVVSAAASDNVGVAGVRFRRDGVDIGAEDTTAPYAIVWNTTTLLNGPYTLTAVARDAAGNTATSAPVTVSIANLAASAWPNEPAGFRVINDQPWDLLSGNGWNYLRRTSSKDAGIVLDAAAPLTPLNELRIVFTPSMSQDSEPSVHWMGLSSRPREIYTGWWMKLSPNWAPSPAGGGKITFLWAPDGAGQVYSNVGGSSAPHRININTEWAPYGQNFWEPNVTRTDILYDRWYRIEWYVKYESSPGAADGILRWWVNGVLNGDHRNVRFPACCFQQFEFAPTLQNPPPAEQYMYIDHTRVSTP